MELVTITGTAGDTAIGPALLSRVRVGGTAATVGAIQIKRGATVLETIPAGSAPGTERQFEGAAFDAARPLIINLASAADVALVVLS